ncbi:hypothetical protein [uncultured Brevundimonas sp.]|uniref:hypothetical protein n=1 Tax=uncultured Brevundimonas sp. TaxID=213418 RepID=UPI0030EE63B8
MSETTSMARRTAQNPHPVFLRQGDNDLAPSVGSTMRGTLALSPEGCLYLSSRGERWLIIWPPETTLSVSGEEVVLTDSNGRRVMIGDDLELGGTGSPPPSVSTIHGVTIPQGCRAMNAFLVNRLGVRKV